MPQRARKKMQNNNVIARIKNGEVPEQKFEGERLVGIRVEKQELLTVHASDGSEVKTDDLVIMRTYRDEDVLCRYKGVEGGYLVTETYGDGSEKRYRTNSIKECSIVESITIKGKGENE